MGVHTLTGPLTFNQANLTRHGEVPLVTVQLSDNGPLMLEINGPFAPSGTEHNINVMGIHFKAPVASQAQPMITVNGVRGGRIAECALTIDQQGPDPTI